MKRKTLLILTIALVTVLSTSSIIAVSQAGKGNSSEYVGYKLEAITGSPTITYTDPSGGPNLIILESTIDDIIEFTVTIDDEVYTYPDDFDVTSNQHTEFNAITGNGFARVEGTITFKLAGNPTLTYCVVNRLTGFKMALGGTLLTPEDIRFEGELELSGTRRFNNAEGFGLTESYYIQPEYTQMHHFQFGLIKGWSL